MKRIARRKFFSSALASGVVLFAPQRSQFSGRASPLTGILPTQRASSAKARIEILPAEPIGTIAPEIYGHFLEHLGGVLYDGVWVGENSRVPNVAGVRKDLIDHLRRIKPSVMRWPGGCFADSYDWRDGIGPVKNRPRRVNFWANDPNWRDLPGGPGKYEPNYFGTHEFINLCRQIGAQPYLAANVRTLPAKNFNEWVDYCNAPARATTLADERAANGSPEPFKVRFWGVGNESWGCGGNFTPEEYAMEYRRYVAWVPRLKTELALIGAGPNGFGSRVSDLDWTRRFFAKLAEVGDNSMWGWALHYYARPQGAGHPINFNVDEWYDMLRISDRMEGFVTQHWALMGETDREHRVKIVVDEWGNWHNRQTDIRPTHIYAQQVTIRDALCSALTLDTFNRHADKVVMSCPAQAVNCLQSLFLAYEDKFLATPNFDVYEMYASHQGAQAVRSIISTQSISFMRDGRPMSIWNLAGSASIKGKQLTLTVVNSHVTEPSDAEIAVRGAVVKSIRVTTLTAASIQAHNTFDNPNSVRAKQTQEATAPRGPLLDHQFPPASVTKLLIELV